MGLGLGSANLAVSEVVGAQDALRQREASVGRHAVRPQRAWLGYRSGSGSGLGFCFGFDFGFGFRLGLGLAYP